MEVIDQVNARFWTKGVPVEDAALQQIKKALLPLPYPPARVGRGGAGPGVLDD